MGIGNGAQTFGAASELSSRSQTRNAEKAGDRGTHVRGTHPDTKSEVISTSE